MILIDDNRTVIAGEALKVMTEIALVLDRLFEEISGRRSAATNKLDYDTLRKRFDDLLDAVAEIRDNEDLSPQEVYKHGKLEKLFPEDFFQSAKAGWGAGSSELGSSQRKSRKADDMLKEAMKKLEEAKAKTKKPKKKKNKEKK